MLSPSLALAASAGAANRHASATEQQATTQTAGLNGLPNKFWPWGPAHLEVTMNFREVSIAKTWIIFASGYFTGFMRFASSLQANAVPHVDIIFHNPATTTR
jgi:hypothetical protein